jgi:AAA+ ATPase superfamily predicted ATPase
VERHILQSLRIMLEHDISWFKLYLDDAPSHSYSIYTRLKKWTMEVEAASNREYRALRRYAKHRASEKHMLL